MNPVLIREWQIVEQLPEQGVEPRFSVVVADPDISSRPILVNVPYTGITDTSITPDSHDLYLIADLPLSNDRKSIKGGVFFRRKTDTEEGGAIGQSSFSNTPAGVVFADQVSQTRKAIMDDTSGVCLTVSDQTTAFGMPGREMLVGKSGVTMTSGSPRIFGLPEEDLLLFKQKGIGQLAPQCFVPPFCFPEYMPNFEFVSQISGVVSTIKAISGLLKAIQ